MAKANTDTSTPLPPPLLPGQMTRGVAGAQPIDLAQLLRGLTVDNPMFGFQGDPENAPSPVGYDIAQRLSRAPVLGGLLNFGSNQIDPSRGARATRTLTEMRSGQPMDEAAANEALYLIASPLKIKGGKADVQGGLTSRIGVTAKPAGAVGADLGAISAKVAAAEKAPLTKAPLRAAADEAAAPTRYAVESGKFVSFVKDTKTGTRIATNFQGPKHLENAAAEAARRNAMSASSESAKVIAKVVPETNPLRKLSTPQLGLLHGVTQNPADRKIIETILGERAFAIAPEDQIAAAINLIDKDVSTQVRRAIRGVPDAELSGVEAAIDKAITVAKLEKSAANRAAVLQGLMDQQAAANIRNAEVNAARAKGKRPPDPPDNIPPPPPEARGVGRQIYESIRSLKSLIDLPLGRQGIRVVGNPIAFAKGSIASIKAYRRGPKVVTEWLESQKSDPIWDLSVKKGGVEYTSSEAGSVVGKVGREEMFPGGAIEQAPVLGGAIQHSNAAYTHSLNVMRYEKFKSDLQQAEWLWKHLFRQKGPLPDSAIAGIGRNVNIATGRGQLGKFSAVGDTLGSAFFSPRNTISWPQFFTDWALHLKNGNPVAAAIQAKTLAAYLGYSIGALKVKEILGEQVEWDPRSSDFMKIVDGDQRTDIMGGGQQWMVALARAATGKSKSLAGNLNDTSPEDVLGSFVMNRTHPALGTVEDAGRLALTTAARAIEGKPFTGLAKDSMGVEYGVLEVILGATLPIIAESFVDAIRLEMETDQQYVDAAKDQLIGLLGFGGGRYRAGVKLPPMGGELGDSTPEKPVTPQEILLSGQHQKEQNEQIAAAKKTALDQLSASQQYQSLPPASQKKLADALSESAGKAASKSFGLNLALNGTTPEESRQGAVIAFNATPKSYDRGQLLRIIQTGGRLTPEVKAAIDSKRDQTDPALPNYDMSTDDYVHGSELVDQWVASPQFIFGTPNEWTSAARAADLLRKMIADDERLGKKPSEDPKIIEFYAASPGLATFYERDGSRRTKYVSPQRKAIEQDLLWDRFASAARDKETPK